MEWDEGAGETAQDWSRKMVYFSLIMKMISMYLGITLFLFEMKLLTKKKLSLILIYYQKKKKKLLNNFLFNQTTKDMENILRQNKGNLSFPLIFQQRNHV